MGGREGAAVGAAPLFVATTFGSKLDGFGAAVGAAEGAASLGNGGERLCLLAGATPFPGAPWPLIG